jgi:zinc transporter
MQTAPLSYGSDQSGLVCGYVFGREADGTGRPLDTEEARVWLKNRAHHPTEFIWLHYNLANTASEKACMKARARPASSWPTTP